MSKNIPFWLVDAVEIKSSSSGFGRPKSVDQAMVPQPMVGTVSDPTCVASVVVEGALDAVEKASVAVAPMAKRSREVL